MGRVGPRRGGRSAIAGAWATLEQQVVSCRRCPRLIRYCREVARVRRRAYRDEPYWGRPVPGFGDRAARILMVGLAPAAHGANRTGRMFTGDRSGDWLYSALHRAGFSNSGESRSAGDGLLLEDVFITAVCRCAPPENRPSRKEQDRCASFLDRELELLDRLRVIVALGGIAWSASLRRSRRVDPAGMPRPRPKFAHDARTRLVFRRDRPPVWLLGSYHPSQQNTLTGRLTRPMFDKVIRRAATLARSDPTNDRSSRRR